MVQVSHPYMTTGKTIALTRRTFAGKVMSLLFKMLYRLVIAFLPSCQHLLISWLKSPSALILEPRNIVYHCCHCFSIYLLLNDEVGCYDFHFLNVEFLARFSLSSFTFNKKLFRSSLVSAISMVLSAHLKSLIFLPAILIPTCADQVQNFAWCTLHVS